jgi:tripartite-type tricarboxylate transporter receptor subunit TctC
MKLPRRNFLQLAMGASALPAVSRLACAQAYPTRPVRLIVGFAAGGGYDIVARLLGQWLSERLGQPFVIENRPGAGTNIATEAVVRAPPDGYTLLFIGSTNAINATFYSKLNFNFIGDIAPVSSVTQQPQAMLANPSFPAKTIPELIDYAKANPGKVNMSSPGAGSISDLAGELFKMMAGVGMELPSLDLLRRRINAIEADHLVSAGVAHRLRSENQANDADRANMIWFCFYPPYIGGESGIARFFRSWGGEALYKSSRARQLIQ